MKKLNFHKVIAALNDYCEANYTSANEVCTQLSETYSFVNDTFIQTLEHLLSLDSIDSDDLFYLISKHKLSIEQIHQSISKNKDKLLDEEKIMTSNILTLKNDVELQNAIWIYYSAPEQESAIDSGINLINAIWNSMEDSELQFGDIINIKCFYKSTNNDFIIASNGWEFNEECFIFNYYAKIYNYTNTYVLKENDADDKDIVYFENEENTLPIELSIMLPSDINQFFIEDNTDENFEENTLDEQEYLHNFIDKLDASNEDIHIRTYSSSIEDFFQYGAVGDTIAIFLKNNKIIEIQIINTDHQISYSFTIDIQTQYNEFRYKSIFSTKSEFDTIVKNVANFLQDSDLSSFIDKSSLNLRCIKDEEN